MVGSINKVLLLGRVGADPEVRRTQSGDTIVNFRLATSESWKDRDSGERKERSEWHNVVVFNKGVTGFLERFLKKGAQVHVEGVIRTRKWKDKDDNDRYSTEIHVENFNGNVLILDKLESSEEGSSRSGGGSSRSSGGGGRASRNVDLEDDIPF